MLPTLGLQHLLYEDIPQSHDPQTALPSLVSLQLHFCLAPEESSLPHVQKACSKPLTDE
jgi:hypothetical protein